MAVPVHPLTWPSNVVLPLMNAAQETMWRDFENVVIKARINRSSLHSTYVESYWQLSNNAVSAYLQRCSRRRD